MWRSSPRNRLVYLLVYIWLSCQIVLALPPRKISHTVLYTATSDLEKLINTESRLVEILNEYIDQEQENLERLKTFSAKAKQNQQLILDHGTETISNPINTFLTIKRMDEWRLQEEFIKNRTDTKFLDVIHEDPMKILGSLLPSTEDLHGAAHALFRLQDTYNLKARVLSDGHLMPDLYTETLSAAECFELAEIALSSSSHVPNYYHALIWYEEALRKAHLEDPPSIDVRHAMDMLATSLYAQGNPERALFITRKLLQRYPDYPPAQNAVPQMESLIRSQGKDPATVSTWSDLPPLVNRRPDDGHLEGRHEYEALCRGEGQDQSEWPKLYCFYKRDTPYSRLSPFKVEVVRIKEPSVVIFRDIVTDDEVDILKSLSQSKFHTTEHMLLYRVSKSAWVGDHEDSLVKSFSNRLEQATGLAMSAAEFLHLSCYGLGGFYEPHFDYFRHNKEDNETFSSVLQAGNRMATVLVYLSTPYIGGSTVFTELKLTLKPTKNDAAFWFNLHRNGTGNPLTRHASCPVLAGTKWIGNKWIHERGQEWRFPCKLENV